MQLYVTYLKQKTKQKQLKIVKNTLKMTRVAVSE